MIAFLQSAAAGTPIDEQPIRENLVGGKLIDEKLIDGLPGHQKTVAVLLAVAILLVVFELVRRRKLREEYSLLWGGTAVLLLVLALEHRLLNVFKQFIGAVEPTSALFFGALVFLMLVSLMFSIRLSKLTIRSRTLSQRIALLEEELTELKKSSREPRANAPTPKTDAAESASDDHAA
ncbi:MAG: DUF2304 domain-containing protein [Planctomycetota bacterium]